jgi:transposase
MWYGYGMRARYLRLTFKKAQELSALKKEAERDGAFRVAKRIHAVLLNDQQHSSGEIARLLEAPRSKVSLWLGQYEEYGWKALLEGHRSGRPSQLDARQRQGLCDILDSGPVAYGFVSGVWTSPMLLQYSLHESRKGHADIKAFMKDWRGQGTRCWTDCQRARSDP